jgi:predicted outer membrane repeat protein
LEGLTVTGGRALLDPNHLGGAANIMNDGIVTATNSTFFNNQAKFGGAFHVQDATLTLIGSSAFLNQAQFGGAIYVSDTTPPTHLSAQ